MLNPTTLSRSRTSTLACLMVAICAACMEPNSAEKLDDNDVAPIDTIRRALDIDIAATRSSDCDDAHDFQELITASYRDTEGRTASFAYAKLDDGVGHRVGWKNNGVITDRDICAWFKSGDISLKDHASAAHAALGLDRAARAAAEHVLGTSKQASRITPYGIQTQLKTLVEDDTISADTLLEWAAWTYAASALFDGEENDDVERAMIAIATNITGEPAFPDVTAPAGATPRFITLLRKLREADSPNVLSAIIEADASGVVVGHGTLTGSVLDIGDGTLLKIAHLVGHHRGERSIGQSHLVAQINKLSALRRDAYRTVRTMDGIHSITTQNGDQIACLRMEKTTSLQGDRLASKLAAETTLELEEIEAFLTTNFELRAEKALETYGFRGDVHSENYACEDISAFAAVIRSARNTVDPARYHAFLQERCVIFDP